MPVVLATDALLWALIAAAVGYALVCRKRPHLAAPWSRVFQSRAAMASVVVLAMFMGVTLLDSLHFRRALPQSDASAPVSYSPEVLSVLDIALAGLRERTERSYSSPLATQLHQRETIQRPDGSTAREFPRLRHGGSHLADESERRGDVATRATLGLAAGVVAWLLLRLPFGWLQRRWRTSPWYAAWWCTGLVLAAAGPVAALASGYHVLGTDKVGQDVLYLALKSIRTSVVIGTVTTLVLLPFGVALGVMAGYFKGWVDDFIQYVYTTLNSIPGVLLIAASVLILQVQIDASPELFPTAAQRADLRLLFLCVILGLTSWTGLARLLRGETLKLRELEFIQAARAFGVSDTRVLMRHVVPNVMHIVVISLVMDFSGLVLAEAVLSYVGVGVDPATTSFGTMINTARLEMSREPVVWWSLGTAFIFMFVLVLAANLFADAVRDGFDPRVRVRELPAGAAA